MSIPSASGDATGRSPSDPVALDLRDHVLFDAGSPAYRPVAEAAELRLGLVCLEPKQALPAGIAGSDRLYTVIGGRAWVVVDDAEVTLDPLQAVLVPHGAAYGVRNDSADPLILQVVTAAGPGSAAGTGEAVVPERSPVPTGPAPPRPADPAEGSRTDGPGRPTGSRPGVWTRLRRLLGSE